MKRGKRAARRRARADLRIQPPSTREPRNLGEPNHKSWARENERRLRKQYEREHPFAPTPTQTTGTGQDVEVTLESISEIADQVDAAFGYERGSSVAPGSWFRDALRATGLRIIDDVATELMTSLEEQNRRRQILQWYTAGGAPRGLLTGWRLP